MSKLSIFLIGIFLLSFAGANAQESKVLGTWLNEEGTSHIRIFKATNGKYFGKIVWLRDEPERLDVHNPDVSKQSAPLLDLLILRSFNFDQKNGQWNDGTIYDRKNGKTYSCYMWFGESNDLLFIKGYILGMKFIGRETQWKRVNE